jgi:hypothetical protein
MGAILMRRTDRIALATANLLLSAGMLACSSASSGGGASPASDGGLSEGALDSAEHDASGLEGAASVDGGEDASAGDSGSGVHNGSCCVESSSDDSMCTSRNEPPVAYVCFCPDGGIDPSCTINMGTELVCCP